MAFNFNDNPPGLGLVRPDGEPRQPDEPDHLRQGSGGQVAGQSTTPVPAASEQSPAFLRFRSCRWHQPPENGNSEFCTHREVKPYAGTSGFDADAWCPDCQHYKLRRTPRKRENNSDYSY